MIRMPGYAADLSLRESPALQKALKIVADRVGVKTAVPDVVMWALLGLKLFEQTTECQSALQGKRKRGRPKYSSKQYGSYPVSARLALLEAGAIARETGRDKLDCINEVACLLAKAGQVAGRPRDFAAQIRRAAKARDQQQLLDIVTSLFPKD